MKTAICKLLSGEYSDAGGGGGGGGANRSFGLDMWLQYVTAAVVIMGNRSIEKSPGWLKEITLAATP